MSTASQCLTALIVLAIMPFFWSISLTLGPTIGGTFAEPVKAFPSLSHQDSIFGTFPYLLLNLICASIVLITVIVVLRFLKEIHPNMRRKDKSDEDDTRAAESGLHRSEAEHLMSTTNNSNENSYCSFPMRPAELYEKTRNPFNVWMLLFAISIKMAHSVTFQPLVPIFLRTPPDDYVSTYYLGGTGGLNTSLQGVSLVMAVNGLASVAVQAFLYPVVTTGLGAGPTLRLVSTLYPLAYILLYIAFIPPRTCCSITIFTWLVSRSCCNLLAPSLLYLFLKRSTPHPRLLGRVNGLATSLGAGMKTLSTLAAGFLQFWREASCQCVGVVGVGVSGRGGGGAVLVFGYFGEVKAGSLL